MSKTAVSSALVLSVLLASVSAAADPAPARTGQATTTKADLDGPAAVAAKADVEPDKVDVDTSGEHLKGLELTLRPSFGGASAKSPVLYAPSPVARMSADPGSVVGGTSSPYGSGFVGQAMLGYRFHPVISAGVRGGYRTTSASAVADGSNLGRTSWDAGFYVRAYPLALTPSVRKFVDPWVGAGVAYMRDVQSFERSVAVGQGSVVVEQTLDHHAVAVPLGIGIDYRVLPMVSIGPSFEYTLANAVAGCMKFSAPGMAGSSYCSNDGAGQQFMKAEGYGVWTAGLDLRATLF